MKSIYIILAAISLMACTSSHPRIPIVCLRNLHDCTDAYTERQVSFCDQRANIRCDRRDWDALCFSDMQVCEDNHGIR
jgi:hypothetical protein